MVLKRKNAANTTTKCVISHMEESQPADDDVGESQELTQIMEKHLNSTRKDRSKKHATLQNDYLEKVAEMREKINKLFAGYQENATSDQATRSAELAVLLKRKVAIEEQMVASIETLKKAYNDMSKELEIVVKGRADDMGLEVEYQV